MLERLTQVASHLGKAVSSHPLDPLSTEEIAAVVAIVKKEWPDVHFNAVTLQEPRKAEMQKWLADPETVPRPHRTADVVAIGRGS
jgi:primary-amine oxidase